MALREQAKANGYIERLEGWPKKEDGITIRCMVKSLLNYPNEPPLLFIAEKDSIEAFGTTLDEVHQKLSEAMRK